MWIYTIKQYIIYYGYHQDDYCDYNWYIVAYIMFGSQDQRCTENTLDRTNRYSYRHSGKQEKQALLMN